MVRSEVAAAYGEARALRQEVDIAREGLDTARDGFRRDLERARQAVPDRVGQTPRPVEVVNSLKLLIEARRRLIRAITDYDQAQFRLFVAMGSPPPLEEVPQIKAEMLIQHGGNDARLVGSWPAYEAALRDAGVRYEGYVYEGAEHGFNNDTTPRFNPEAAAMAWGRTLDLFRRTLS